MAPKHTIEIVCLANSRKTSGRCIAGKILNGPQKGQWVRPVSERSSAELSEDDRRFYNGQSPRLLDILQIPMKGAHPHAYQTENHLIDDGFYWSFVGRIDWQAVEALVDTPQGPLWENLPPSTNGIRDRVAENNAANIVQSYGGSLKLIASRT